MNLANRLTALLCCTFLLSVNAPSRAQAPAAEGPKVQSSLAKIRDTGVVAIAFAGRSAIAYLDESKRRSVTASHLREIVRSWSEN